MPGFAVACRPSDYAFILHMIETIESKTGHIAVGVLLRGSSPQKLIEENLLDAAIGLPEKLYVTGISAAILVFRKDNTDNNVLLIDSSCEFKFGKNQTQLSNDNIAKVVDTYKQRDA
tara:strand:+ start:1999 stop:2349 length:351 start_codon:yes stop_codon:yes gene_type:complete